MPPGSGEDVSVGELARQVRDVLIRFEGLVKRLEEQFVRKEILDLYRENVNNALMHLQDKTKALEGDKADEQAISALAARVGQLEDDKKWLIRLVIGFIVLGVLGLLFAASGGGGVPK